MDKVKIFFKGIGLILFYFIITIIVYNIFYKFIYSNNFVLSNISTIFADLFILFIFILIYKKDLVPAFYDFKNNWKKYLKKGLKYYIIGFILMEVSQIVISLFTVVTSTNQDANVEALTNNPLSSIVSMVIVAPIIEELITRHSFKKIFNNKYAFILFSGFLFGSLHLLSATSVSEIVYIFPYSFLGMALAAIYYKTDNVWSNITFHSLHNLLAILLILGVQ